MIPIAIDRRFALARASVDAGVGLVDKVRTIRRGLRADV